VIYALLWWVSIRTRNIPDLQVSWFI
jgi:hypothetical protein